MKHTGLIVSILVALALGAVLVNRQMLQTPAKVAKKPSNIRFTSCDNVPNPCSNISSLSIDGTFMKQTAMTISMSGYGNDNCELTIMQITVKYGAIQVYNEEVYYPMHVSKGVAYNAQMVMDSPIDQPDGDYKNIMRFFNSDRQERQCVLMTYTVSS